MPPLSIIDEAIAASRAVLMAAQHCLEEAGLIVPARCYVSVQEGDWAPGTDLDVCDQLVVVPFAAAALYNSPTAVAGLGGDPSGAARVRLVDFRIIHGGCVNLEVRQGRLVTGDVTLPYDDNVNAGSHWSESVPVIAARWAFARRLPFHASEQLCAAGLNCRGSYVSTAEPWLEGGCAGTSVTLQVQM